MAGNVRRAPFITLEGPDGAGKSTQGRELAQRLRDLGAEVVLTREPGGTPIGEQIRDLLLHGGARDPLTDGLLFNAARRQLVRDVIEPALARGAFVICDRYTDSTLAYQGYGAGVSLDQLRRLADVATDGLRPTRTLLFDVLPAVGLTRRAEGSHADVTRFESATEHDLAFHERVRAGYLELAGSEPERWRIIDAARPEEEVAADVWLAVEDVSEAPSRAGL